MTEAPATEASHLFKQYLGDGVYASFDGYQIWLRTLEGHQIALEPAVYEALTNYCRDLKDKVSAMRAHHD